MARSVRVSGSGKVRKKGKKNRKFGRNTVKCARYRAEGRREKNKARRAAKLRRKRQNWLKNCSKRDI